LAAEIADGDSVAVDGICLTATEASGSEFAAEAMNQTLRVTALGGLGPGKQVNLELAAKVGDRLGGHIVQGHVDGLGTVSSIAEDGFARRLGIDLPEELLPYVIDKGSITLSGVSLTVASLTEGGVEVSLIPETLERTNLGALGDGAQINVEVDLVAKYVERIMGPFTGKERA
jgi:riboflavin synthase